jgi:hypothetical protein
MRGRINPTQLFTAPRCGAKTRSGAPCQSPAVRGKRRCRMHGGNSPGAPKGNRNAMKHGRYCESAMAERRQARAAINRLRELMTLFRECESEL